MKVTISRNDERDRKVSNETQRQKFRKTVAIEPLHTSMKPVRVAALKNAIGKIESDSDFALAKKVFDRANFGRANRTGMATKADKSIKARYGKLDRYVSHYGADGEPVYLTEVDQSGRVMLPSERGTIKKNRGQPRSAASKRGGVGAKNKIRASAMVDQFLRDADNQARELASVKAAKVLAHFAGVDIESLPRKQRQSACRAVRKALANL